MGQSPAHRRDRWRVRVGCPWRDTPDAYGPWQTIYGLFRRWQRAGVWQQVLTGLQAHADAVGLIGWDVSVDSTITRAYQQAAGARTRPKEQKEPSGGVEDEPADHALGRSRGGLTTKLHLACEQGQKPLAVVVTGGQRGDSPQFTKALARIRVPRPSGGRPRIRPGRVLADEAYSSVATWEHLRRRASRRRSRSRTTRPPTGARRVEGRTAADLRPRDLQAAPRRRVLHQPAQTQPRTCHQVR